MKEREEKEGKGNKTERKHLHTNAMKGIKKTPGKQEQRTKIIKPLPSSTGEGEQDGK